MRRLPIFSLTLLLLLTIKADCRTESLPADIRKEFVRFDQAFLPVLFYVAEGNGFEAKRAVFHLGYHWQQLRQRYEMTTEQPEWKNAFKKVDKYLDVAFFAIDANQLDRAFIQLQQVKREFFYLRAYYHIDYYLDYLYDFQATADLLNETVQDEMLGLLEWEDVMAMSVELNRKWNVVLAKRLDAALYEFDEDQLWKLRTTQKSLTEALDELNTAMECADRAVVAEAGEKLNLAFVEVLRLFGNFGASATYYANTQ